MKLEAGYYRVGQQIFSDKLSAIMESQRTGTECEWDFFSETFSKVDWKKEPTESLDQLYRRRALKLRHDYDYLIGLASGGPDSSNAILSFINNGIFIDEVMGIAPMSALRDWNWDNTNLSESNTISEIKYAMFPFLEHVSKLSPKTRITIHDYWEDAVKRKDNEWLYQNGGNVITPLSASFTDIVKFEHINKLIMSGKKVGIVTGIDKPIIKISDTGDITILFADTAVNCFSFTNDNLFPNLDRIYFYWSNEMPEILVKQYHTVMKNVISPQNKRILETMFVKTDPDKVDLTAISLSSVNQYRILHNQDPVNLDKVLNYVKIRSSVVTKFKKEQRLSNRTIYQRLIVPWIYPSYKLNLFQVQKIDLEYGYFLKDQAWLHATHAGTRIADSIQDAQTYIRKQLSDDYINGYGTGMRVFLNRYPAGNIMDFLNKN